MKLNLSRVACQNLTIRIPIDEKLKRELDRSGYLSSDWAWAGYRRNGREHAVVVSLHDDLVMIRYITGEGATPPSTRGSAFQLLELLASAGKTSDWNVHADFAFPREDEGGYPELRMTIPIRLFTPGSFTFTELRGYRAVDVGEDGEVKWSAVVDFPDPDEELTIGVSVPIWNSCEFLSALNECIRIRDSLLVARR